jgi:hypothetical protein
VLLETKLETVFGWWDWDAETPALVNRVTGERVVYRGRFQDADIVPPDEVWLRFDYLYSDLEFPLLVSETLEDWMRGEYRAAWCLDYDKSLALWQRETQGTSTHPAYGVWRRVDDCMSDALCCWPDPAGATEGLYSPLSIRGGWLNGQWKARWLRTYQRLPQEGSRNTLPVEVDPWLMPLDTETPSPWVFHAFPGTGQDAELEVQTLLNGLEIKRHGDERRLVLPTECPLDGLQGRTAYLLSADSRRLLYPMEADTDPFSRRGHSSPKFRLLYADGDVVCDLVARHRGVKNGASVWTVRSTPFGFGFRSDAAAGAVGDPVVALGQRYPSHRLWLRLQWALFDGWSNWQGTTARSPLWLDELHLPAASAVHVTSGYRGGMLMHRDSTFKNNPNSQ